MGNGADEDEHRDSGSAQHKSLVVHGYEDVEAVGGVDAEHGRRTAADLPVVAPPSRQSCPRTTAEPLFFRRVPEGPVTTPERAFEWRVHRARHCGHVAGTPEDTAAPPTQSRAVWMS